jgi:Fe-S-cluster-containing hydrogenase component 2
MLQPGPDEEWNGCKACRTVCTIGIRFTNAYKDWV